MSEEKEKELKDLEKEPKKSRNKTGSNIDERIAGRRSAQQGGNEQKWKMDCENE